MPLLISPLEDRQDYKNDKFLLYILVTIKCLIWPTELLNGQVHFTWVQAWPQDRTVKYDFDEY